MLNVGTVLIFLGLAGSIASTGRGQEPASGYAFQSLLRPLKFATPRETLKTLYFSIIAYDFHPALIDDAVACLETRPEQAWDIAEAARLAIGLDTILQELCLPVNAVPESSSRDTVVLYDRDGFKM